jgi:hypothetical protein
VSRRGELPKNVAFQRLDVARAGSPDEPFAPLFTPCIHGNPQNGAVQLMVIRKTTARVGSEKDAVNAVAICARHSGSTEYVGRRLAINDERLQPPAPSNRRHTRQPVRRSASRKKASTATEPGSTESATPRQSSANRPDRSLRLHSTGLSLACSRETWAAPFALPFISYARAETFQQQKRHIWCGHVVISIPVIQPAMNLVFARLARVKPHALFACTQIVTTATAARNVIEL